MVCFADGPFKKKGDFISHPTWYRLFYYQLTESAQLDFEYIIIHDNENPLQVLIKKYDY